MVGDHEATQPEKTATPRRRCGRRMRRPVFRHATPCVKRECVRLPAIVIEPKRSGNSALEKLLQCPRRLAWRSRTGDFYPANLTEIIIDIDLPPVASSPLDRGWHIALTPLRAPAIRDYLDVRAMNGCPTEALELVGSITGDDDKALSHGLTRPVGRTIGDLRGRGRAAPAHGIPSRLLRRVTCASKLGSRALVLLSACGAAWNR